MRLLAALALVVLVGAVTAWMVASVVAPTLFHEHMRRAGPGVTPEATAHAEQAFRSASEVSLAMALLAALAASVAVSVYLTRRLARSIRPLRQAAATVAAGRYDARVPLPGLGPEFDHLAGAFNQMAGRLQRVDETRRRLLADLAHELRTPVATLDAYLEGLEDGVAVLDAETVTMLRAQTTRLARLADDVSAVSRAEEHRLPLHLTRLALAEVAATATAAATDRYAAKGVHLTNRVHDDLPSIDGDRDRLAQVLGNLLDNALRHTPSGGTVSLTASRHGPHTVTLQVTDSGEGIPAEHLPHVFERFYRVDTARDRDHGGSGIGLAVVKALTEAHGGTVVAHSHGPGQGSRFSVTLPTTPTAHQPSRQSPR